jgi:hypothetical protein
MNQPLRSQAIKTLLTAWTHPDLAALYTPAHEVQVIVSPDGGEMVEGDYKGRNYKAWTDHVQTWKPIRMPHNAYSVPEDNDCPMSFDLAEHAEGIGCTGWNWRERQSEWVGFDFDAISGHCEQHGRKLTDAELSNIKAKACQIPWVTVRKSTSGKGLHLYVFLKPVSTGNHTEHQALARSILDLMSAVTGFDFQAKVDVCGGNMWLWHRKQRGTDGLTLIKQGEVLEQIPLNWKDHVSVVSRKRPKALPAFVEESGSADSDGLFEELCGRGEQVPLDDDHRKLMSWLDDHGYACFWNSDYHMLQSHTYGLKEAHRALELKGVYDTISAGSDPGGQNCFMFPMRKGAWAIRRYGRCVKEAACWAQDGEGWTRIDYNRQVNLAEAARICGGAETPSGGFCFHGATGARQAAKLLGADVTIPAMAKDREVRLKRHKDGRLIVEVRREKNDPARGMAGWVGGGEILEADLPGPGRCPGRPRGRHLRRLGTPPGDRGG